MTPLGIYGHLGMSMLHMFLFLGLATAHLLFFLGPPSYDVCAQAKAKPPLPSDWSQEVVQNQDFGPSSAAGGAPVP
jgi:hypothetical protein